MIKYSIHTLELHAQISSTYYNYFYDVLSTMNLAIEKTEYPIYNPNTNENIVNQLYIYRHFTNFAGINSIVLISTKRIFSQNYCVQIRINPYNALYKCSHSSADIIEEEQIKEALNIIQVYLGTLFPLFPITAYSLKRLDFCLDIKFSTQKQADEYIKLLKKSLPGKILKEKTHFDLIQRRNIPYNDSLLLTCKSYSFEAYLKYPQMITLKKKNTETAWGIVRLELRASKRKIEQLAGKYCLPSPKENMFTFIIHSPEITRKEIPCIISRMIGSGSFYAYSCIIDKIESSDFSGTAKEYMIGIVKYCARHKNCGNLLNDLHLTRQKWNAFLEKFNILGCSPVPIPRTYEFSSYPGVRDWNAFETSIK